MKKEEYINPFSAESEAYAKKIDDAEISGDIEKLEIVLKEAESTLSSSDMASQAQLYYSIGTAYSCLAKAKGISQEESIRKQLYCFRKSIDCIENPVYSKEEYVPYINGLKRLLYTNYANTLSECGRKIEVIFQYKKALNIDCNFGMVLGNLGIEYKHYGLVDYDNGHQHYFHHFAYTLLRKAEECKDLSTYT